MTRDEMLTGYDSPHILFGLFFALSNRLQAAGDDFYEEITCKQLFLLICLNLFQQEPPTVGELSKVSGSSHQNIKQLCIKLEKSGYISMETDAIDKRKIRIKQTDKIKELEEKYHLKEIEFFKELYKGTNEEALQITIKTLSQIEQNLVRMRGASTGRMELE